MIAGSHKKHSEQVHSERDPDAFPVKWYPKHAKAGEVYRPEGQSVEFKVISHCRTHDCLFG